MRADKDSGTEIAKRADINLRVVLLTVRDLPEIADEWSRLPGSERATLSLEWTHMMADYLTEIDEYHRAGQLTKEQEEVYRRLKGELKEAMPLIEELNFYRPPVEL